MEEVQREGLGTIHRAVPVLVLGLPMIITVKQGWALQDHVWLPPGSRGRRQVAGLWLARARLSYNDKHFLFWAVR